MPPVEVVIARSQAAALPARMGRVEAARAEQERPVATPRAMPPPVPEVPEHGRVADAEDARLLVPPSPLASPESDPTPTWRVASALRVAVAGWVDAVLIAAVAGGAWGTAALPPGTAAGPWSEALLAASAALLRSPDAALSLALFILAASIAYHVITLGALQATLGQKIVATRMVARRNGGRPSPWRALMYGLGAAVGAISFGAGPLFALWIDRHRRGAGDWLAGTLLVTSSSMEAHHVR